MMRKPICCIVLLAVCLGMGAAWADDAAAQKSQAAYQRGLAAEKAGDPKAAIVAYEEALMHQPQNANARFRLGQVKVDMQKLLVKGFKAKYENVIIDQYQVQDVSLEEALGLLGSLTEKASNGKVHSNFVLQSDGSDLASRKVSLNLKSTPASQIIEYLTEACKAKARYDEHAVVIQAR
ncbi:MAG TPA: tetratricopeptide repeat protein [Luteolibacter sp.]|nr:tetratricopeptide repeat protein [Luteolibacter sp.]